MAFCEVTLSWHISSGDLSRAVIYRREDEDEENSCSPTSLPSTGLICIPPQAPSDACESDVLPSCTVSIHTRCPPYNVRVSALDILSDARHMEVYSDVWEYIETCRGMPIRELEEGHKLYLLQHTFEEPVSKLNIKLLSLHNQEELWLHTLHITVAQDFASNTNEPFWKSPTPTIDVEKVQSMVKEMGREIPAGGQELLQAIQTHKQNEQRIGPSVGPLATMLANLSSSTSGQPPDFASMLSMMGMVGIGSPASAEKPDQEIVEDKNCDINHSKSASEATCTAAGDSKSTYQDGGGDVEQSASPNISAVERDATNIDAISSAQLTLLEKKLTQRIRETEARLENIFSKQMHELEEKLGRKLDTLIETMNSFKADS